MQTAPDKKISWKSRFVDINQIGEEVGNATVFKLRSGQGGWEYFGIRGRQMRSGSLEISVDGVVKRRQKVQCSRQAQIRQAAGNLNAVWRRKLTVSLPEQWRKCIPCSSQGGQVLFLFFRKYYIRNSLLIDGLTMTQGAEETNGKWGPQAVERGGEDRREN